MPYFSKSDLYDACIELLSDVKLLQGPTGVNSTLRRHPELKTFLLTCQRDRLDELSPHLHSFFD